MKKIYIISQLIFCSFILNAQTTLRCFTMGQPDGTQTQYNEIGYYLNNSPVEYNGCQINPAIIIAVLDPSCTPWNTCNNNFGQANQFVLTSGICGAAPSGFIAGCNRTRPENYFIFHFNVPSEINSISSLLNAVPSGHFILAYTWYTFPYSNVAPFSIAFQNLGAPLISSLPDSVPYIFFMQKGDSLSIIEIIGNTSTDTIQLIKPMNCSASVPSQFEDETFDIFPNPVSDAIKFTTTLEEYHWKIYGVKGDLIKTGFLKGGNEIKVGKLAAGNYFLRLEKNDRIVSKMFTVPGL